MKPRTVWDDLNFLVENPNKTLMSVYHDAGRCWDLIEAAVEEIRKLRKQLVQAEERSLSPMKQYPRENEK